MTRRTVVLLVVGLLIAAAIAAAAFARRSSTTSAKTSPSWGLFSPSQWDSLKGQLQRSGFRPDSARVVAGGQRLALVIASRATGGSCLIPVRVGGAAATPLCSATRPLTIFTARSAFEQETATGAQRVPATDVVGVVGTGVASVVAHWDKNRAANQALSQAGRFFVFGSTFRGTSARVVALDKRGHEVARVAA